MPKTKQTQYGIVEQHYGGLESFLQGFVPSLMQGIQEKRQRSKLAQDMIEDLEKRRLEWLHQDPDLQEQDLSTPSGRAAIAELFDDSRILRLQGKKVPQGYTPTMPTPRQRTQSEKAKLDQALAESRKTAAEAQITESNAALVDKTTKERLELFKNPQTTAMGIYARTGKFPSGDEVNAALMTDPEVQTKFRQGIQGTLEYKTAEAAKTFDELQKQHQPQTKAEIDALQKTARYIHGLETEMPVNLGPSLEKQRLAFEERRVKVAETESGLSRARLAMDIGKAKVDMAKSLVDNGMPVEDALRNSEAVLESGIIPKDMKLEPDKKAALQMQIDAKQLEHLTNEILLQSIINPKVKLQLEKMRLKTSDAPPGQYGLGPEDYNTLAKLAGVAVPPTEERRGWLMKKWDAVWNRVSAKLGFGDTTAASSPPPEIPPGETSQFNNRANTLGVLPQTGKTLSPETLSLVKQTLDQWEATINTNQSPDVIERVKMRVRRLQEAVKANDEAAIRQRILEQ